MQTKTQPNNDAPIDFKFFIKTITDIFVSRDIDVPISIFKLPNSLTQANPEAYLPQLVGLGAFHHLKPELREMQMVKVIEAKRVHKGFKGVEFKKLAELLQREVVPSVRASYNMYLNITDDALACIMSVDGLFLFGLLCCYSFKTQALANSSLLNQMVSFRERRLAQDTTLKEALMLENQVPLLVLNNLLAIESSDFKIVSEFFPTLLLGFCDYVSPFAIKQAVSGYPLYKSLKHAHLLDLLYHLIMLEQLPEKDPKEEEDVLKPLQQLFERVRKEIKPPKPLIPELMLNSSASPGYQTLDVLEIVGPESLVQPITLVQNLLDLPWTSLRSSFSPAMTEDPPEEESLIPRALKLHKAGVKFNPVHITKIEFKSEGALFSLPSIKLGVNSEVVIRNLVAYEAMTKYEKQPLMKYVEIMCELIKTVEDVRVLKDDNIVKMESISELQVVKIFNEMSKSMQLKKIDATIEGVEKYYNDLWKVKARKFIKKGRWIAGNWGKVLTVVLLLLLMGFQAFCSVYKCPRLS